MFFLTFAAAFACVNAIAIGGGAWLLRGRGHHAEWGLSLLLSTLGTLAGGLLLGELGVRVVASQLVDDVDFFPLSNVTLWCCWVWSVFCGPTLFATAFLYREKKTPRAIYALQLVQILAWVWSSLMLVIVSVRE